MKYEVQSVRVSKKIPLAKAEAIVKKMGYNPLYRGKKTTSFKKGESENWWRFRQLAPSKFKQETFRTKILNKDVEIITGILKS